MTEKKKPEETESLIPCTFESFGFKKEILDGIRDAGFKIPSPVQEQVMPLILKGNQVFESAEKKILLGRSEKSVDYV